MNIKNLAKDKKDILKEIRQIKRGGGFGSIIGRNSFQRPKRKLWNY